MFITRTISGIVLLAVTMCAIIASGPLLYLFMLLISLVGGELFGKTFGVVGTGAIGSKVAKIAQAFGCKVVAYSRTVKPEMQGAGFEYLSLEEVLKVSDIVSLHVPLNDKTKGLIGEKEIALMKKNVSFLQRKLQQKLGVMKRRRKRLRNTELYLLIRTSFLQLLRQKYHL